MVAHSWISVILSFVDIVDSYTASSVVISPYRAVVLSSKEMSSLEISFLGILASDH